MPTLNSPSPQNTGPAQGFQQKEKKKDFPAIPEGLYDAEVVRMEYRSKEDAEAQGKTWPAWKKSTQEIAIGFKINRGEFSNRWFWVDAPFASLDSDEGTKLRIILQELIGMDSLPESFVFNTDELDEFIGFDCRIRVSYYWSNKANEFRNSVREVLRPAAQHEYVDADGVF